MSLRPCTISSTCQSNIYITTTAHISQNNFTSYNTLMTLAIVPATFNSIPKADCYYNFIEMSAPYKSQQNLCCASPYNFQH